MALDRERAAFVAARRFGLGARPGEIASYRSDPRAAVRAQLDPAAARLDDPKLPSSPEAFRAYWAYSNEVTRLREDYKRQLEASTARRGPPPGWTTVEAKSDLMAEPAPVPPPPPLKLPPAVDQTLSSEELVARLERQVTTTTPLVERLVNFWSNHFCISVQKNPLVRSAAGAYEREVVRPHVLGRFHDMAVASARHPAMLVYLDNFNSIGPTSPYGLRTKRGLNENLGREIIELHTLGVDGGYTQADVTAFATALTGWSYADTKGAEPGTFVFFADRHSPGPVRILDKDYPQPDVEQGEAALADFARHPSTARHVTRKLVRHFVGDDAAPGLADRLAGVFLETEGDLGAVTAALLDADEAWNAPPAKVLSPWDLLVATGRMLDIDWSPAEANRMLNLFGQPLWNVPFPSGWPDDDYAWAAPNALLELLSAVSTLSRRNAGDRNVLRLANDALGPFLGAQTRRTIERAETRDIGLSLLIMSPDFLKR